MVCGCRPSSGTRGALELNADDDVCPNGAHIHHPRYEETV
jgi:hypothetical protein